MVQIKEIKEKIAISNFIKDFVQLTNKGNSGYVGLCPFHTEKTPSFFVNDNYGSYRCFGCGAHGDILTFITEIEGISYKDAIAKLAKIAGITFSKDYISKKNENKNIFSIYEKTFLFYQKVLFSSEGKCALDYILSRGISKKTLEEYQLGYSPKNSNKLKQFLMENNFTNQDIKKSNLLNYKNGMSYDPMAGRLIFPIKDENSKIIAFGGRGIKDHQRPKYLNSSENPIFQKSQILYNYDIAKTFIHKSKEAVIVEGYMDVLALANVGIKNVVAPLGASIKYTQIEKLWKYCDAPKLCFDNDLAGMRSTKRIAYEVLPIITCNKSLKIVDLSSGKDPDEILKNRGLEYFKSLLSNSIALADYIFYCEKNMVDFSTPEGKIKLKYNFIETVKKIKDKEMLKSYRMHFYKKYYELLTKKSEKNPDFIQANLLKKHSEKDVSFYGKIIALIAKYPGVLKNNEIFENLIQIELPIFLDTIRKILLESTSEGTFGDEISNRVLNDRQFAGFFESFSCDDDLSEETIIYRLLKMFKINNLNVLKKELDEISTSLLKQEDQILMEKFLYLKRYEKQLESEIDKFE